jgi:hypothetical protein
MCVSVCLSSSLSVGGLKAHARGPLCLYWCDARLYCAFTSFGNPICQRHAHFTSFFSSIGAGCGVASFVSSAVLPMNVGTVLILYARWCCLPWYGCCLCFLLSIFTVCVDIISSSVV